MIQGNATLVVDLGNSSTKCKVLFGKDPASGKFREKRFDLPNVFAPVPDDYVASSDYKEDSSTILEVDSGINGMVVKGKFCNGEIQRYEKPTTTIKPSATEKKYNLTSTVLSYRLAFLHAFKAIMQMQHVYDYNQLDITWKVVTLLPPGDLDTGKDKIIKVVEDIKEIESTLPKASVKVKIEKTIVLPEGYCAYAGVVYDRGFTFRKGYEFLTKESVLVIDIGAGTTDILLIQNNKLTQDSKQTIQQGGNNVFQKVRQLLRLKKGIDLNPDEVQNGIITGKVKDGATVVDITEFVNMAKADVAQKLVTAIYDYFELVDINVRSIGYVILCGGGSMQDSENEAIEPLSKKVIESFKQLAPNSELVQLPNHTVSKEDSNGDVTKVEEMISPRDLNLIGASILAESF